MFPQTAKSANAPAIAALHARSWQRAYRGVFSDHYLDVECSVERLKTWTERFAKPDPKQHCSVIFDQDQLAGFCCTFASYDEHGAYLDNLHVASEYQGKGLGRLLMQDAARGVPDDEIYLVVLVSNAPAIAFYRRMNGRMGHTKTIDLAGTLVEVISVHWKTSALAK